MERTISVMVYAPVLRLLAGWFLVLGWYLLLGGTLTSGLKLDSYWIPPSWFLCKLYVPYMLFLIRLAVGFDNILNHSDFAPHLCVHRPLLIVVWETAKLERPVDSKYPGIFLVICMFTYWTLPLVYYYWHS